MFSLPEISFVACGGAIGASLLAGITLRNDTSPLIRIFLVTGILGGFTTFSAFGLETITLFRSGHLTTAMLYVLVSVVGGCAGTLLGLVMTEPAPPLS